MKRDKSESCPSKHTPLKVAFARPWPTTRRGLKLWLISVILGFKGLGYLMGDTSQSTTSALRLITERLEIPLQLCGGLILATCVFAAITSYCHHGRDRYGYMALSGFSTAWAAAFAVSPLFLDGPTSAFQGAASYVLITALILFSAGDPELPDPAREEPA